MSRSQPAVTHGGLDAETAAHDLEVLEAYVASGVEFEGGESPRDIAAALTEFTTGDTSEEATG